MVEDINKNRDIDENTNQAGSDQRAAAQDLSRDIWSNMQTNSRMEPPATAATARTNLPGLDIIDGGKSNRTAYPAEVSRTTYPAEVNRTTSTQAENGSSTDAGKTRPQAQDSHENHSGSHNAPRGQRPEQEPVQDKATSLPGQLPVPEQVQTSLPGQLPVPEQEQTSLPGQLNRPGHENHQHEAQPGDAPAPGQVPQPERREQVPAPQAPQPEQAPEQAPAQGGNNPHAGHAHAAPAPQRAQAPAPEQAPAPQRAENPAPELAQAPAAPERAEAPAAPAPERVQAPAPEAPRQEARAEVQNGNRVVEGPDGSRVEYDRNTGRPVSMRDANGAQYTYRWENGNDRPSQVTVLQNNVLTTYTRTGSDPSPTGELLQGAFNTALNPLGTLIEPAI